MGDQKVASMFLLCPSFTLVLILFLGAAINSSPIFLRSFIDPKAPEENKILDKRSYYTFPNVLGAYGFNFSKIRGKTAISRKSSFTSREDWRKWKSRAVSMKKLMDQPGLEAKYYENGLSDVQKKLQFLFQCWLLEPKKH